MYNSDVYFGRRVRLTIVPFSVTTESTLWAMGVVDNPNPEEGITLEFNRKGSSTKNKQTASDLCPRIDFWVMHAGEEITEAGSIPMNQQAKIDLYNIGPSLKQYLDAYNKYIDGSENIPKFGVTLQVGNDGLDSEGSISTIFVGFLSSFNVERVQTDKTVDDVWHLLCWYPFNSDIPDEASIVTKLTREVLIDEAQKIASNPVGTAESCLKEWIMSEPRCVYKQSKINNIIKDSNVITQQSGSDIKTISPIRTDITPDNFNNFFEIRYLSDKNKNSENKELKQVWEKQKFRYINVPACELHQGINFIARYLNCKAEVVLNEETGKLTINIYQAGARLINSYEADYNIINFQNLVRPPEVSANLLTITMLLDPSVRIGKTVSLLLDESFNGKQPSFIANFSQGTATNVFAGTNFAGQYTYTQTPDAQKAMENYGNIFNKQYFIRFVEFQGSTHNNTWTTKMECYGVIEGNYIITG